ncbi:MAG: hypothetical protein KDJ90_12575 [Nitratireductor sp.]|nr:hypothetical protein [Nitratireductor sp.]
MKAAHETAYEAEDRLVALRTRLARHAFDGVELSADDVRGLLGELEATQHDVIAMRCELTRQRWEDGKQSDRLADLVVAEAIREDSNLVLFPVAVRPIPGDAPQRGGSS